MAKLSSQSSSILGRGTLADRTLDRGTMRCECRNREEVYESSTMAGGDDPKFDVGLRKSDPNAVSRRVLNASEGAL